VPPGPPGHALADDGHPTGHSPTRVSCTRLANVTLQARSAPSVTATSRSAARHLNQSLELNTTSARWTKRYDHSRQAPCAASGPAPRRRRSWWPLRRLFAEHGVFGRVPTGRSAMAARPVATTPRWAITSAPKAGPGARDRGEASRTLVEQLREHMVAELANAGNSADMRDWGWPAWCARWTDHLESLGNPTWYARFAAQAMTDPAYYNIIVKGGHSAHRRWSRSSTGSTAACPTCRADVRYERNVIARNLLMHTLRRSRTCARHGRRTAQILLRAAAIRPVSTRSWSCGWRP